MDVEKNLQTQLKNTINIHLYFFTFELLKDVTAYLVCFKTQHLIALFDSDIDSGLRLDAF